MNKKSNYLIIALLFVILAMGWQLYIRTQPTEKEQEEAKKEAEKIPEPEGIKIYEKSSNTQKGLLIGVESISSFNATCNFTFPNGAENDEYMKVGKGFCFWGSDDKSYEIRLLHINNEDYGKEYAIFGIKEGNSLEHPYREQKKRESTKLETEEWEAMEVADINTIQADTIKDGMAKNRKRIKPTP